ncbi:MAG: phosphotransferase [Agathobacter sp.]|nr:phosphotransferase [Agathobacter sp.]
MYNQTEAILSQYEIEVREVTKGRGAFICDTDKGKKLLMPFRGSKEKGMLLFRFLAELERKGFQVEQVELTKNKEAVSEDEYSGERFLLKTYVDGTEISTSKLEEMKEAVRLLAIYHNTAEQINLETELPLYTEEVLEIWHRHYRELIKVRNYIRNRKKKTEFEQIYMKHFEHNRSAAEEAFVMLENVSQEASRYLYCHGEFNQHNVLLCNGKYQIVHFENFAYNWSMTDLANFLRKMLEKNEWNEKIGVDLLKEYDRYRPLRKEEYQQLYGLLLFPEKFWKVTNHYMSSRKTWISGRDIDKLKKVIEQEEKRLNFIENIFAFLK